MDEPLDTCDSVREGLRTPSFSQASKEPGTRQGETAAQNAANVTMKTLSELALKRFEPVF